MGCLDYDYKNVKKERVDRDYVLSDRKLRFFYHRFYNEIGNIQAIKESEKRLVIGYKDLRGLMKLVSELRRKRLEKIEAKIKIK